MKDRLTELNSMLEAITGMETEAVGYKAAKGYRGGTILSKIKASIKALTELTENIQKTVDQGATPSLKAVIIPNASIPQDKEHVQLEAAG